MYMYVCLYIYIHTYTLHNHLSETPVPCKNPFLFSSNSTLEEEKPVPFSCFKRGENLALNFYLLNSIVAMPLNQLYCFVPMDKAKTSSSSGCEESSLPLSGLLDFFLVGFLRWVLSAQSFFSRFWHLLQQQLAFEKKNEELELSNQWSFRKHEGEICREEVETVMRSLGLFCKQEHEGLQERYSSEEISSLFEEKEPSLEEVKEAFDVFDVNRDGFIDATELQRVLTTLGLKEGSDLENCRKMIRSFDGNEDGMIDFHEFVKFMENRFC
ncbi:PREDICTED: probable calcium-binding protein CML45 [Tarenaya hassleriana]|uniref:probable calcium-binding protein CML45 n=1 Tax=Tarenaya hassleriana TaxID=28532 RepID=UPI00053C4CBD|nr:PREDICTED: probable calcium-binding protein CML45 [Tarenaya hassleriana]